MKVLTFRIIFLFSLLIFLSSSSFGQSSYTCLYLQNCNYNTIVERYDNCIGAPLQSKFEIDKAEKIITLILPEEKISYAVLSKQRKNRATVVYRVSQENGENIFVIVNSKEKEIRILMKKNGNASLKIYSQNEETD